MPSALQALDSLKGPLSGYSPAPQQPLGLKGRHRVLSAILYVCGQQSPWQTHRTEDCLLQITLTSLSHSAGSSPASTFQRGLIFSLAPLSRHRATLPLHILPLSHECYMILFRNLSAVQNCQPSVLSRSPCYLSSRSDRSGRGIPKP